MEGTLRGVWPLCYNKNMKKYEKGQMVQLTIDDQTETGEGFGRTEDGMSVFVQGAILGETVRARVEQVKKGYLRARCREVLAPSSWRTVTPCPYQRECGGCPLGCLNEEGQLMLKERHVRDKLERLAGLERPLVRPIVAAPEKFHYRNKAVMAISAGGLRTLKGGLQVNAGPPRVGFVPRKSHDVVDCLDCRLQPPPVMAAAETVRQFMLEDHITAYDPRYEKGLLRHLIVRTAHGTGEVMVILVVNGKGIPGAQKLVAMLDEAITDDFWSLESVIVNVNRGRTRPGQPVWSERFETLAGRPVIRETLGGLDWEISPLAFYQVSPAQTERLYAIAMDYAGIQGGEKVLDLYCGVGTIGLFAMQAGAGSVLGIESVHGAVVDANRNAVINGIVNARYLCGKAEEILPALTGRGGDTQLDDSPTGKPRAWDPDLVQLAQNPDVIFLDPPRTGCKPALLDTAAALGPARIVYVSCDPATLARDIRYLGGKGYQFVEATPVEMFPQTGHVETVVLMSRKDK